ncbi:RNA-binding domain-containing protein [Marasmius fiardii PR-910]|nr:RNA-binding domain-containing protein [Marasmius fiardii PR-910]
MSRLLTKTFASHLATGLHTSNSRAHSLLASRQSSLSLSCSPPISSVCGIRRNSSRVRDFLNLTSDYVENNSALGSGAPNTSSRSSNEIYVARLPWRFDNASLAEEFASCGEVISATVMRYPTSGRSRGYGFVRFSTSNEADNAMKLDGKEIDGMTISVALAKRVKYPNSPSKIQTPSSKTLYVGNMPYTTTEESLRAVFNEWGVKNVTLGKDRDTGRPQGYAFVEFETSEGAQGAFDTHKSGDIDGRPLRLGFARQPQDADRGGRGEFRGGRGGSRGGRDGSRGGRGGFNGGRYGGRSEGNDF